MTLPSEQHAPVTDQRTVAEQVQELIDRGMDVSDQDYAGRCLTHIGFHRLASYWWPWQSDVDPSGPFRQDTSFEGVMTRYLFDQRLRSLLLEALSYIEISIRNQWSFNLVQRATSGEYAHLDAALFDPKHYDGNLRQLRRNYESVRGRTGPEFRASSIWDVAPTMSFGSLSKWYSSLSDTKTRQDVAQVYGVNEVVLRSVLRHLTAVRNICAHHERLWNTSIEPGLRIPRRAGGSRELFRASNRNAAGKIYNGLVVIVHLLDVITPDGGWTERFIAFVESGNNRSVPMQDMGFPPNWRDLDIWRKRRPRSSDG